MFFATPSKPTKLKKALYLLSSTVLGVLLSVIAHALIEINYISWALRHNYLVPFYGGCALPPWLQVTLWLSGVIGGFLLGRLWWRKVYIEKVWKKNA